MRAREGARILGSMSSGRLKRTLALLILLLAFFGMADAAYLATHAFSGEPLICDIGSLSGCTIVASSTYSVLFGVPLAVYGVVFYALVFVLAALELVFFNALLRRLLQGAAVVGAIAGIVFTFIQVYLINALCIYCLMSAVVSFLILVCASMLEPVRPRLPGPPPPPPATRLPMPPPA